MKKYLKLLRVHHYIKNLLVFLPLIFSKQLFDPQLFLSALIAFISFSFAASIVYVINDIKDAEKDRLHSTKCKRPIASGAVKKSSAIILAAILFIVITVLNVFVLTPSVGSLAFLLIYIVMNIFYSCGLKSIPIFDVAILAFGFLLRLLYGASVTNIELSNWFYLTTMLGSFYLGFGKRRNEIRNEGTDTRAVLKSYSYNFLDKNMYMCLSLAIVFYSLWTIDVMQELGSTLLIWTIPLLILISMKYNLNIEKTEDGDPTEVILRDKVLLGMVLLFGLLMLIVLYGKI